MKGVGFLKRFTFFSQAIRRFFSSGKFAFLLRAILSYPDMLSFTNCRNTGASIRLNPTLSNTRSRIRPAPFIEIFVIQESICSALDSSASHWRRSSPSKSKRGCRRSCFLVYPLTAPGNERVYFFWFLGYADCASSFILPPIFSAKTMPPFPDGCFFFRMNIF